MITMDLYLNCLEQVIWGLDHYVPLTHRGLSTGHHIPLRTFPLVTSSNKQELGVLTV